MAQLPDAGGWTFYGPQNGGPQEVFGVTSDGSGNIWVAGGMEGLFVLPPGANTFRKFTVADGLYGWNDGTGRHQQKVISVAGGPADTVFVGYEGLDNCQSAFEQYNYDSNGNWIGIQQQYAYIWKSGDADRVVLNGNAISVSHVDISSPPDPSNPNADVVHGREKICTVLRMAYDSGTHVVWLGGNHGVAFADTNTLSVTEHFHPAFNGYLDDARTHYTLLTDLYYGVSVTATGGVWLGGADRSAFCAGPGAFWSCETAYTGQSNAPRIDIWPDQVETDSTPSQRVDDEVWDMAAMADGTVWVASVTNGLAHVKGTTQPAPTDFLKITSPEPNSRATALEVDPVDGSLWVGFLSGGLARWNHNGNTYVYGAAVLNNEIVQGQIPDIQSDHFGNGGSRRILVAFRGIPALGFPGVIGIYAGE